MNKKEFGDLVQEIYGNLPKEIQDKCGSIYIEEEPSEFWQENFNKGFRIFGYWNPLTPGTYTLCYEAFKHDNDFSRERIENVMKHEFEHLVGRGLVKHSEHE